MTGATRDLELLRVDLQDGILTVTIDRPAKRNAIDLAMIGEFRNVLDRAAGDDVSVVVVTGAGEQVFVSGADINDLRERRRNEALLGLNNRLFTAIEEHPRPFIAAVNGLALGGGLELALACDLRVLAEEARLGFPETGLGIMPAAGGTQRLPRLIGLARAKELVLTGNIIDAGEALRYGLATAVVPRAELLDTATRIARRIAGHAPLAVGLAKASLNRSSAMPLGAGLELESISQAILFESDDKEEGMAAFLEKRRPVFRRR